jgi:endoplasmic reticulum chaperone BiP
MADELIDSETTGTPIGVSGVARNGIAGKDPAEARGEFESYLSTIRLQVTDESQLANKIDQEDKQTILENVKRAEDWLSSEPDASVEDIAEQQTDLESVIKPIIVKLYQNGPETSEDADSGDGDWFKE